MAHVNIRMQFDVDWKAEVPKWHEPETDQLWNANCVICWICKVIAVWQASYWGGKHWTICSVLSVCVNAGPAAGQSSIYKYKHNFPPPSGRTQRVNTPNLRCTSHSQDCMVTHFNDKLLVMTTLSASGIWLYAQSLFRSKERHQKRMCVNYTYK